MNSVTPLKAVYRLLEAALENLSSRDLQEAMPHEFFVALGVAEKGTITEEATRLLKNLDHWRQE